MFRPAVSLSRAFPFFRLPERLRSSLGLPSHLGPAGTVRLGVEQLVKVLGPVRPTGAGPRPDDLHRVMSRLFDLPRMAQEVLGPHWSLRSLEEQVEFTRLFETVLLRALAPRLQSGKRFVYSGPIPDGRLTRLRAGIVPAKGAPVVVEYRLRPIGPRWVVDDLVLDGRSIVDRYREQVQLAVEESSYEDVIWKLRVREIGATSRL